MRGGTDGWRDGLGRAGLVGERLLDMPIRTFEQDLNGIEVAIAEAESAHASGDYVTAGAQANACVESA